MSDDPSPDNAPYPFKLSTRRGPFTTHNGPWYHWVGKLEALLAEQSGADGHAGSRASSHAGDETAADLGFSAGPQSDAQSDQTVFRGDRVSRDEAVSRDETVFRQGVRLRERHCNSRGHAHGGFLSAFADGLLATAIFRETGRPSVTIRLTTDFLRVARVGDWMQGTAYVERATRSLVFVEARAWIGEAIIEDADTQVFSARAVFKFTD